MFFVVQLGYTPLHQAAQQGKVDAVKALLQHAADPNALTAVSHNNVLLSDRLCVSTALFCSQRQITLLL